MEGMVPMNLCVGRVKRRHVIVRFLRDVPNPHDVVLRKKEIRWIDVSSPHEGPGLFLAPARVGFVYQPALTLHEEMKITAGA